MFNYVFLFFFFFKNTENLPPHFKRGTLSVLKKKWENPVLGSETRKETLRSSCVEVRQKPVSPSAGTESSSASQAEIDKTSGIGPRARLDSSSGVIGQFRYPSVDSEEAKPRLLESGKMENCLRESRQEVGKPEANENSDSSGKIEKSSVPLSRLKMMFERGDATQIKVRNGPLWLFLAWGGIAWKDMISELQLCKWGAESFLL